MNTVSLDSTAASAPPADVIDLLAGPLTTDRDRIGRLRRLRPQARENAQRSFTALLEPADPAGFEVAERYAVAAFVALLHRFDDAADFYLDLLREESEPVADAVTAAALGATATGPFGAYREPGLRAESTDGTRWTPGADLASALGDRVAAALGHAHLLVLHPREARAAHLRALVASGWEADGIVTLSQLIAFLTFQLRTAWGLRVLAEVPTGGTRARTVPSAVAGPPRGTTSISSATPVVEHPELDRPVGFTQEALGWVPWIDPVRREDLSSAQHEALLDDFRRSSPYFRLLVRDPEALVARTLTDKDIFFNPDGRVGRAERELAATATSRVNGCVFCASVHAAAAIRESGRERDVQRLLDVGVAADLGDPVWNAVSEASAALAATPLSFGRRQITQLRTAGLRDDEIVDVIGGAAFFNWANRLMLSLGEPEIPTRRRNRS